MRKLTLIFIFALFLLVGCNFTTSQPENNDLTDTQKDIYQLAVNVGYSGTYEEWLASIKGEQGIPGEDGKNVELILEDNYIKWHNTGDSEWYNLISLDDLVGESGREVNFQVVDGYIKWQYAGDTTWTNLLDLNTLVGPIGQTGPVGPSGANGKEVTFQVSNGYIMWQYVGDATWKNLVQISSLVGPKGDTGTNGKEVSFQVSNGYIMWQYIGDQNWTNLVELTTLIGPKGDQGNDGLSAYQIYLKYHPTYTGTEEEWVNNLLTGIQEPTYYTVSFYSDDVQIENRQALAGERIHLPTPTKEGYTFLGWYSGFSVNDGKFTNIIPITEDTNLYAKWEVNQYTISFITNTTEELPAVTQSYNSTVNEPIITKEGYTFLGWYTDEELTIPYTFSVMPAYDFTLYAKWDIIKLTVTFDTMGGSNIAPIECNYNSLISLPNEPTKQDTYFMGWYLDSNYQQEFLSSKLITEDITLYAKWYVNPLTLTGENSVIVGETIVLTATNNDPINNLVYWESSNTSILSVDQNGVVMGISSGMATVTIKSVNGDMVSKEITVIDITPTAIEISPISFDKITLSTTFKLTATVLPQGVSQDVIWSSSNVNIATVDNFGNVTPTGLGEVTISATAMNTNIVSLITFAVEASAMDIITLAHRSNPTIAYDVMFWGNDNPALNQSYDVYGSVSDYYFGNINIDRTTYQISSSASKYVNAGTIDSVEFIVVHDTASATGNAAANASWAASSQNTSTSWHYTVGNDGIYQSLPENIIGWHAGDGVRSWNLTDTGIVATTENPTLEISKDGYWIINGQKSTVSTPRDTYGKVVNAPLTDSGIYTEIGSNGHYYIGSTYYNTGYGVIANTGGGANGIGIETAMNNGSDLYLTYHYTAKLVSQLLISHNLGVNRVHPHNYYSGKDCPRTMRNAGLWDNFVGMVKAEYMIATQLNGYTIQFKSNNLEYVNNMGRIIKLPLVATTVSYQVTITSPSGNVETKTFYTNLPAIQS